MFKIRKCTQKFYHLWYIFRTISSLSVKKGISLVLDEKKNLLHVSYFKEKKSNGLMWIWLCSQRYNLVFAHPCLVHPAKHEEKRHNRFDWIYRMFHHYKCKTTDMDYHFKSSIYVLWPWRRFFRLWIIVNHKSSAIKLVKKTLHW